MIRVRFAPSPTGLMHQGNIRAALFNYLFVRKLGGRMILRIDDTDQERSQKEFETAIIENLHWLGLDYDEGIQLDGSSQGDFGPYRQSERLEFYQQHLETLHQQGKVYECYCRVEEIEEQRKKFKAKGLAYRYTGQCRTLTDAQREEKRTQGLMPTYRFRVESKQLQFNDLVYGQKVFDTSKMGDFIIARSDRTPLYIFCSALDDVLMKISHVIRGEDGIPNTPRQILIQEALGFESPQFAHLPLILGSDHTPLSKRNDSMSIQALKAAGYLPKALLNYLALLGWAAPEGKELLELPELIHNFELTRVVRHSGIFDWGKLKHFNQVYLSRWDESEYLRQAKQFLEATEFALNDLSISEAKLDQALITLRPNIQTLGEIAFWLKQIFFVPTLQNEEARLVLKEESASGVLQIAEKLLADLSQEFSPESFKKFISELKKQSEQKGKKLFMPLRVALTDLSHGPELIHLFQCLGPNQSLERIRHALKNL